MAVADIRFPDRSDDTPCLTRQRDRWTLPNAHLFVRPDGRRFAPQDQNDHPFAFYEQKYRPDQPRVPAGNADGGQWTSEVGGGGIGSGSGNENDPRVFSDASPDPIRPGAQYAQTVPRRPVAGGGGRGPETPAQSARLAAVEAQARDAIARVRELDPNWRPTPSFSETVEEHIASAQAETREAQARLSALSRAGIGPGPYAGESIPARGPERDFTAAERREINRIGSERGCHTCGDTSPGTIRGNFVPDHQLPNALNHAERAQRLYPQCISCSKSQGGWISGNGKDR